MSEVVGEFGPMVLSFWSSGDTEPIIDSLEKITLPAADWDAFYDALVNPPRPNDRLREAARRYRRRVGG